MQSKVTPSRFFKTFDDVEKAWYVWELRKEGYTHSHIAKQLGITAEEVRDVIRKSRKELIGDIRRNVEEARALAIDRMEGIISMYTPIAKAGKVRVSRGNGEEPYTDDEWKYCLLAGKIVLEAIREVAKLEGVYETGPESRPQNERVLMFLKETEPKVTQIVEAQPVELINQKGELDLSFPRD
jgi:predicted transcriptional regulator